MSRKEGWREYIDAPKRGCPESLSRSQIRRLGDVAADIYPQQEADWHNNIGPLKTPQLVAVHDHLWDAVDANAQYGNRAKGAVELPRPWEDHRSGSLRQTVPRREIRRHGEFTRAGDERWPVCRIGMRGITTMKDFNAAMCDFYAHPGRGGTAEQLGKRALDCVFQVHRQRLPRNAAVYRDRPGSARHPHRRRLLR